jgi:glycosyltransferase involved in cell wall biosynthesis
MAPHDVAFVFSGKMIPKKDPELVLAAIRRLPETVQRRIHWLALGDGELRGSLSEQARALCGSRASFPGFVNQRDLGRWYAAADCLILPSRAGHGETWGLVVNEAFHFGLPAIVSDGVGCQPDLVPDHRTGRIFLSANIDSLATAIRDMAGELPAARTRYAEAVKSKISRFTTARAAEGIAAAVALATGIPKSRAV